LVEYIPLYSETQNKRHNVRPGLTGYAQVNGRNALSWGEKFMLDVYYVNHITFKNDLIIILKTILKVLRKDGINQTDTNTMESFKGNKKLGDK